jgi:hypothetical protein
VFRCDVCLGLCICAVCSVFVCSQAIDSNRHAVLMTLLDARPMVQVTKQIRQPAQVVRLLAHAATHTHIHSGRSLAQRRTHTHTYAHTRTHTTTNTNTRPRGRATPSLEAYMYVSTCLCVCVCICQVFLTCMELISRLAGKGLIHCDFNEFNLLLGNDKQQEVRLVPSVVSATNRAG